MQRRKIVLLLIMSMLILSACAKTEEKKSSVNQTQSEEENIEKALNGTWELSNSTIDFGEELCFDNGTVTYAAYVLSNKDNASESAGVYSVSNHQIKVNINGHITYFNYSYENDELILSRTMDDGADAGETRIYKKVNE